MYPTPLLRPGISGERFYRHAGRFHEGWCYEGWCYDNNNASEWRTFRRTPPLTSPLFAMKEHTSRSQRHQKLMINFAVCSRAKYFENRCKLFSSFRTHRARLKFRSIPKPPFFWVSFVFPPRTTPVRAIHFNRPIDTVVIPVFRISVELTGSTFASG